MTKDDLMIPRYEVISDWFGNEDFEVGQVLTLIKNNDHRDYLTNPFHYMVMGGMYSYSVSQDQLDLYPHLFRKIGWWENRNSEDLPMYLKWRYPADNRPEPKVIKVKSHFNTTDKDWRNHSVHIFAAENAPSNTYTYNPFVPATEQEYLTQKPTT